MYGLNLLASMSIATKMSTTTITTALARSSLRFHGFTNLNNKPTPISSPSISIKPKSISLKPSHSKSTRYLEIVQPIFSKPAKSKLPSSVVIGAVSVGIMLILFGSDDHKAMAFGPEGPLVEEFWENVRRYGIYALTVSTGAIYAIVEPILELLKNPISAVLVVIILVGSFFIISQVLSAMVGISTFSYEYGY